MFRIQVDVVDDDVQQLSHLRLRQPDDPTVGSQRELLWPSSVVVVMQPLIFLPQRYPANGAGTERQHGSLGRHLSSLHRAAREQ